MDALLCPECNLDVFGPGYVQPDCKHCAQTIAEILSILSVADPEPQPELDDFVPEMCPLEPKAAPKKASGMKVRKPRKQEKPRGPRAKEQRPRKPKVFTKPRKPYKKQNPAERKKKTEYTVIPSPEKNKFRICVAV